MKKFKSALSLLTAAIMVFAMMPGVMAEGEAEDYIKIFGTGTNIGDGIETDILDDGYYYTSIDVVGNYPTLTDYRSSKNLDKVVKFTEENSGIEFFCKGGMQIKRLDLWILSFGGIKEYTIEEWDNVSQEWIKVQDGSFGEYIQETAEPEDDTESAAVSKINKTRASYYPVILNRVVNNDKVRFVIKSFYDTSHGAFISEALLRDTNDIDLGQHKLLVDQRNKSFSPYIHEYNMSGHNGSDTSTAHSSKYNGYNWYYFDTGVAATLTRDTADKKPDSNGVDSIWYTTNFFHSRVKINKVGISVASGTITQFEVWAAEDKNLIDYWPSQDDATYPLDLNTSDWEKIATINCNLTSSSTDLFEIPNAKAACSYMIRVPVDKFTPLNTAINSFKFYSVADYELLIPNAFDGVVVADNKASINISDEITFNGKTYDVVWESDSEYLDIETGDIAPHDADEEITLKATITVDGNSYSSEKKFTLPAFENSLEITAFNGDGSTTGIFPEGFNESLFTDKYYRVAYDYNLTGTKAYNERLAIAKQEYPGKIENPDLAYNTDSKTATAEEKAYVSWCTTEATNAKKAAQEEFSNHLEKVAKFTTVDSGIQWSWTTKTTTKRLDLWLIGKDGINEYEVQKSDNGVNWSSVQSGEFEKGINEYAYYYPIVFNEPVKTKNLRIVFKSYHEKNGGYVSQAIIRDTNDINLGAKSLIGNFNDDKQYLYYSPYLHGFNAAATKTGTCRNGYEYVYPTYSSGTTAGPLVADKNGLFYYATTFGNSKVKVNKIGAQISGGTVTKLKVYVANGSALHGTANPTFPLEYSGTKDNYTKEPVAVIECNLTADNTNTLFEIPKAIKGNGILIVAEGEDIKINTFDLYSVADYELTPVAPTEEKIEGTVAAGQELTYSVFSCNYNAPDAKVFFALYEDGALSGVTVAPCALSGVKTAEAKYTIPETASGTLKVVAYLWDGKTLKPLVDTPVVAEPAPAEDVPAE